MDNRNGRIAYRVHNANAASVAGPADMAFAAFLLIASLAAPSALAFSLSGTVTNQANGQKLAGVRVELAKAGLFDTTDSQGHYRLGEASSLRYFPSYGKQERNVWAEPGFAWFDASHSAWFDAGGRARFARPSLAYAEAPDSRGAAPRTEAAAKTSAGAMDTLRIRRAGYKAQEIAVEAVQASQATRDVVLVPEAAGCGAGALCWDFEAGRIPDGWTAYRNEFAGTLLVDATRPHRGAYALHAKDLLGGMEGAQGGPKKTLKYTLPAGFGPVLWGRAFVYATPARPNSHAGLFNARYPRPGSASPNVNAMDWYELATYQQTYMAIWHPPEPPGYPEWVLQSEKPLVLDAWACVEWVFDGSNADRPGDAEAADPRVWVDSLELAWPKAFVFSDPPGAARPNREKAANFGFLEVGIYLYQGLPAATNWWIDDLAVAPRRIGCD